MSEVVDCCFCSSSSSSSVTVKVFSSLPRMTVTCTVSPISCERTLRMTSSAELTVEPSMPMMMSPFWMPAVAAGPFSVTSET